MNNFDATCVAFARMRQTKYMYSPEDGDYEWLVTSTMRLVSPHTADCLGEQTWTYMIPAAPTNDRYSLCLVTLPGTLTPPADDVFDRGLCIGV